MVIGLKFLVGFASAGLLSVLYIRFVLFLQFF